MFTTMAEPVYIITNSAQEFPFLHTLANTGDFLSFLYQPL